MAGIVTSGALAGDGDFDAFERTIPELQAAMEEGETSSADLVRQYLARIEAFDQRGPALNAMLYVNPRAVEQARTLDVERATTGARGPLHGIPVVIKDNFDTHDMPTTAGSVALRDFVPAADAFQVQRLRDAGVVIVGKTNLHEFARGIETVSSLGGYTRNPYDPGRNPGGSSGGTAAAVAANFAAIGMGSDTCGSIRIPAANNNLFGLRVTQGLSSRTGIVPLAHTQDVAGPLARTVVDLAIVLDATVGADPDDAQTAAAEGRVPASYRNLLDAGALQGARLGLLTAYLRGGLPYGEVSDIVRQAAATMSEAGAEIVEVDIEGLDPLLARTSVIDHEFVNDLEGYLWRSNAPVRSFAEVLDSGRYHAALERRYRRSLDARDKREAYRERLAARETLTRLLIDTLDAQELDALIYPTLRVKPVAVGEPQYGSLCRISAHSGLPAISMPAGFTADGLPVGVELLGKAFDEGALIALAHAWEQVAAPRRAPGRTPSLRRGELAVQFELRSPRMSGTLRFDRPSQVLHYALRLRGATDDDVVGILLHRSSADGLGPVIATPGNAREGSVEIRNEDVADLLAGRLQLVALTRGELHGTVRGRIFPLEHSSGDSE